MHAEALDFVFHQRNLLDLAAADSVIKPAIYATFQTLLDSAGKLGMTWLSNKALATRFHCTKRTIQNHIRRLEQQKHLVRRRLPFGATIPGTDGEAVESTEGLFVVVVPGVWRGLLPGLPIDRGTNEQKKQQRGVRKKPAEATDSRQRRFPHGTENNFRLLGGSQRGESISPSEDPPFPKQLGLEDKANSTAISSMNPEPQDIESRSNRPSRGLSDPPQQGESEPEQPHVLAARRVVRVRAALAFLAASQPDGATFGSLAQEVGFNPGSALGELLRSGEARHVRSGSGRWLPGLAGATPGRHLRLVGTFEKTEARR